MRLRCLTLSLRILDRATLLAFADRLDAMARSLPRWDPAGSETWDEFAEREYEAEMALARELRGLHVCQLVMDGQRRSVRLALFGIQVRSKRGLGHSCHLWVEQMRAHLAHADQEAQPATLQGQSSLSDPLVT